MFGKCMNIFDLCFGWVADWLVWSPKLHSLLLVATWIWWAGLGLLRETSGPSRGCPCNLAVIADLSANIYPQSNDMYGTMETDLFGRLLSKIWKLHLFTNAFKYGCLITWVQLGYRGMSTDMGHWWSIHWGQNAEPLGCKWREPLGFLGPPTKVKIGLAMEDIVVYVMRVMHIIESCNV